MHSQKGNTFVITGASRGIGKAIALKFAKANGNIAVLTKDTKENCEEVSHQIEKAGGRSLILDIDVSDTFALKEAIGEVLTRFGDIDVLVNNTSATLFSNTLHTSPEQFDLCVSTSARAAFFLSQFCFDSLKNRKNPHIINISPPLYMEPNCFKDHLAFSLSKYAMSLCTMGMAEEFRKAGIAVNSLWPKTTIATQTIQDHFVSDVYIRSRWPSIMADAAYELTLRPSKKCTGHFFIDEEILRESGVVDFSHYAVDPTISPMKALFIPDEKNLNALTQDLFLR